MSTCPMEIRELREENEQLQRKLAKYTSVSGPHRYWQDKAGKLEQQLAQLREDRPRSERELKGNKEMKQLSQLLTEIKVRQGILEWYHRRGDVILSLDMTEELVKNIVKCLEAN